MDSINPTPPPRAFGAAFGSKFYRYRTLVRSHWWILALTISAGLAIQAWRVFTKPDLYESTSELRIREQLTAGPKPIFDQNQMDSVYGDTIKTLQSPEIAEGAKRRLELEAPTLSGSVDLIPSIAPKTSIFTVSGRGTNPEYTRRFVDAAVEEFKMFRKRERGDILNDATSDVSAELRNSRKDLEAKRQAFQAFVEKNDMGFWQKTSESSASYLNDLRTERARLQDELQRLRTLSPEQLLITADVPPPAKATGDAAQNPSATPAQQNLVFAGELRTDYLTTSQQLTRKKDELEDRKTVWKPKHPRLRALESEVQVMERRLETLVKQSAQMAAGQVVANEAKLKSLDVSIEAWNEKVQEATRMDAEYKRLQSAVARAEEQENKWSQALIDLSPNSGLSSGIPTVLHKASAPMPVPKGIAKHLLLGFFGGLLVGGTILFFLDRSDDRLASSSEMLVHFTEPILAQIPNVTDTRTASGLPLVQPEDERYAYAESFRSLRSSLIFMPNQADLKTLVITSAIPNEGKSTIASNLAVTMASSGARVLLVDADLRRGDLAALFDTDGRFGLSSILRDEMAWQSVVQTTRYETLSLIPRGPVTNQSGELLLKPGLVRLLEEFKSAYDLVIFNTAPILATDDTPTLAPHFDGTLMIVRAQFTSARLTQNALNALYQRQVNVLGLILNSVDTEMPDYYYYRYPKYYAA